MTPCRIAMLVLSLALLAPIAAPQGTSPKANSGHRQKWKEYAYPNLGFAISFPQIPKEQHLRDVMSYSIYLRDDVFVHLYADNGITYCNGWEEWAKDGTFKPKSHFPGPVVSESKVATIDGHVAIIGEFPRPSIHAVDYSRQQCLSNRMYSFWARWPDGAGMPQDVRRIIDSFHTPAKNAKQ